MICHVEMAYYIWIGASLVRTLISNHTPFLQRKKAAGVGDHKITSGDQRGV